MSIKIELTDEQIKDIIEMHKTVASKIIAAKYKCSINTILKILNDNNISTTRKKHFIQEQIDDIIHMHKNKIPLKDIGTKYGCGQEVISKLLEKYDNYVVAVRKRFTDDQVKEIIELYKTQTAKEIATKFHCRAFYISKILKENNIYRKEKEPIKINDDELKNILSLYETLSFKELCKKVNISSGVLRGILKENGVEILNKNHYHFKEKDILDIIDLYKTQSVYDIADAYDCSVQTIRRLLRKNSVEVKNKGYIEFTKEQVDEIIKLYKDGNSCATIGGKFHCSYVPIRRVLVVNDVELNIPSKRESKGHISEGGYRKISIKGVDFLEHRLVMEKHLGRKLTRKETIHHIDGDKLNNNINNLQLYSSNHHAGQRVEDKIQHAIEILNTYVPEVPLIKSSIDAQLDYAIMILKRYAPDKLK